MRHDDNDGTIDELLRRVQSGRETLLQVATTVEGDKSISLGSRELQPEPPAAPAKMESNARAHTFADVPTAAAYVIKYGGADTVILADVENEQIDVTLDETATHGREVCRVQPVAHPLLVQWLKLTMQPLPVALFAIALLRLRRTIKPDPTAGLDARSIAMAFSQVQMGKKTSVDTGVGKKAINAVIIEVDIKGSIERQPVELPDSINVELPLYLGTPPVSLGIDLLVVEERDAVLVHASAPDYEQARLDVFTGMVKELQSGCKGAVVGCGSTSYVGWDYIIRAD